MPKPAPGSEPSTPPADSAEPPGPADEAKADLRSAFREALVRKRARNTHPESHLDGHTIGGASNDTRKRQFRRKSG
ncbi:MAG: DUF5302 domain-containing protein [Actinomycetota bacterium]|nr:DUF5302 domain-containing protein [Actinomycetota bacterium]